MNSPLHFDALINDVNFTSRLNAMEQRILGFSSVAVRETSKIDNSLKLLGGYAAGAFAFTGLAQLPQQLFKVRAEFQQLEISLNTILRSKTQTDLLLGEAAKLAANSPFGLKEVSTGTKQLLAYGFAAKEVIPTLRSLGDISAGLGLPLERLTYLYGTTKTQGRLFAQDLNQFVGSGIPLIQELAKQFGVAETEVRKLVEEGKVGFPQVKKAIESLTSGSGIFAGTLDAQSKSLNGLKERLSDAYDLVLNEIGKKNEDFIASIFTTATEAVQNYQKFIDALEIVAATYGTYRAAVLVANIVQRGNIAITAAQAVAQAQAANTMGFLTLSQTRAAAATALTTRAQVALNTAMRANPIVLVATAIVALASAYFILEDEIIEVKSAQELLAESTKEANAKFNSQKAEITSLVGIIKNQNIAESERLKAYERLNSIAPKILDNLDFQKAKTADLTQTLNEYLDSLQKQIRLESVSGKLKQAFDKDSEIEADLTLARNDYLEKKRIAELSRKSQVGGGTFAVVSGAASGAEKEASDALKKLNQLADASLKNKDAIKAIGAEFEGVYKGNTKEAIQAHITKLELAATALKDKLSPAYKQNEDELKNWRKQLADANAAQNKGISFSEQLATAQTAAALRIAKGLATTDNQIDAVAKKAKELAGDATRGGKEKADLESLSKEIDRLQGKKTKAEKDAEKVGPFGSLSYWDNVIKKAEEAIEKTNVADKPNIARQKAILDDAKRKAAEIRTILESPAESIKYYEGIIENAQKSIDITPKTNTAELEKQKQIIVFAQTELEQIRKSVAIVSFEEELSEKRDKYELYQKWVESYGQVSADQQFQTLITNGKSYVDFLNTEIAKLEQKKSQSGVLSEQDTKNLGNLIDQRNEATGKKSAIDVFREGLEGARQEAENLTDYLEILKTKQEELGDTGTDKNSIDKRLELAQRIAETEANLRQQLKSFLANVDGSSDQQLSIQKRFADLRAALDKQYNDKRVLGYTDALAKINTAEKEELASFQQRQFEQTEEYKKLTKVILEEGRKGLRIQISNQQAVVESAKRKYGVTSEVYRQAQQQLNNLTSQENEGTLNYINQFAVLAGQLGDALTDLGGDAAEAGRLLSGLSSGVSLLTQAFKANMDDAEKVQIGVQGIINLVSTLTTSAAQRKQAEKEYYDSIISAQQEYNLLLNEQIGLQSETNESVFVKDYAGRFKDNYTKLTNAQKQLDSSFDKLQKGRLLSGQKNALDGANIGKAAISGAAIGAVVAGPIGAAIGAIGGAIVGIFGGKKKKDVYEKSLLAEYPDLIQKGADGTERLNVGLAEVLIKNKQIDEATRKTLESTIEWQKQVDEAKAALDTLVGELAGALGDKLRNSLVDAFRAGSDAAEQFRTDVTNVLEDLISQMVFATTFGEAFKVLGEEIKTSLSASGDQNTIDDFGRFYAKIPGLQEVANRILTQSQDVGKQYGFDLFQPKKEDKDPKSLSGAIKGVTEETASVLAGQINAIRISQAETGGLIRQQLLVLSNIDRNTGVSNRWLESIDDKLAKMGSSDPLRAKGL